MLPRALVLLLALSSLLAGCLTSSQVPGLPPLPAAASGAWRELCGMSNWTDPCSIRASFNDSPAKTEIDLAVNPKDPLNVVVASKDLDRQASNCVWAVAQVTKDGGRTWKTVYVGGTREQRMNDPTNPLFGWECITDPIMTFDNDGTFYYPLQAYNQQSGGADCFGQLPELPAPLFIPAGCGSSFYLARSKDGGDTYDRIIPMAIADGGVVFHDYPRMFANPKTGTVSTVWNAVGAAGVSPYVVSTRDKGESVDPPVIAAPPDAPRSTAFASGFVAATDGTVYMTTYLFSVQDFLGLGSGGNGKLPVYLAVSTDDARSFSGFNHMFDVTPITCPLPNSKFRCFTAMELAIDNSAGPHGGRLYSVWADQRFQNNSDVLASWSDDQGQTWSEPVRVNQDTTTHAQWMPRPVVGPDGTLHVLYMDRSYDPGDKLYDATHAWSADGGQTWRTQRLTSVSSDGDLGVHQNGFPFIGDYVGIGIAGDHLYMGFPQTVTGKAEVAIAHVVKENAAR